MSNAKYHSNIVEDSVYFDQNVIVVATKSEFSAVPVTVQTLKPEAFDAEVDGK